MNKRYNREDGFTIVELMVALTVLAIGFFSLAAAMGIGLKQVSLGRQRQSAAEIANARLEHLRNYPYEEVALSSAATHNTDVTDPDYGVSNDGSSYEIPGPASSEALIVDSVNGKVQHFEDPVQVGTTFMKIYQYVTWVDDPAVTGTQDYKRVEIAAVFKTPSIGGVSKTVYASAFVTTGSVIVNGTGSSATVGSPSPTPSPTSSASPTPSPTPSSPCPGDTTPPSGSFSIESGSGSETGYTASNSLGLKVQVSDGCSPVTARFSSDGSIFGDASTIQHNVEHFSWATPGGDGTKSVWGKFADGAGNTQTTGPFTIVVDATKPSTPGTLTFTKSCSGSNRTVSLSWGASTDANFRGYRIYKSVNNGAWAALGTVSTTTMSDTDSKSLDSLRYYAVGYDKAGNESNASNTVSLTKNQC
ncbi:MAG: prepilin-type N-terminal cleavage/methylation domain-containing protein [Actinomycetota bacterium]|nr:prepilin-type N-terminal cleavage/methylation domain-containing protein [Actinomycetota bacterium]